MFTHMATHWRKNMRKLSHIETKNYAYLYPYFSSEDLHIFEQKARGHLGVLISIGCTVSDSTGIISNTIMFTHNTVQ